MKIKTITKLLYDAYEKDIEDKLWQQWLVDYSRMNSEHFTSFQDYKKESMKPALAKVDIEEVLKEAEEIKRLDQSTR